MVDGHPFWGANYYRLKQVDHDGSFTYSSTLSITIAHHLDRLIEVFPNPLSGNTVKVRFAHNGKQSTLIVRNLWGQEMMKEIVSSSQEGFLERNLVLPKLASGIYLVELKNEQLIQAVKLMVK
jgi:hypothetical protein